MGNTDYIYADFLKMRMWLSCGAIIVIGMLFVLFGAVLFRKKHGDIVEGWMIIAWFIFAMMAVTYAGVTTLIHYADIKNEDFLVYTGKFEKDQTREFIFLNDENSTRLTNTNATFLNTGSYSGKVVYSRRTKYVLRYSLDTGEDASVAGGTVGK